MFAFGMASTTRTNPNLYCQTDTTKSDYGQCYVEANKAYFVQSDTTTYPVGSLPCEKSGTCTRLTSTYWGYQVTTVLDTTATGKQAIMKWFYSITHASVSFAHLNTNRIGNFFQGFFVPFEPAYPPFDNFGYVNFNSSTPFLGYDPVLNLWVYVDRYSVPVGYVNEIQYNDNILTQLINLFIYLDNRNNIYFLGRVSIGVFIESSPMAVIPLDYSEYLKYNELRRTFGYSADCINQPGWNADDMIRVLKELFSDKAWMVLDDRDATLYLWNVNFTDMPDWLLHRLNPTRIKVLKSPSSLDTEKSLFAELEKRNYAIQ
jgi:hypothetical protein